MVGEYGKGTVAVEWPAMPGHYPAGALDERPQALERRGVLGGVTADHRPLDRREVVAADQHLGPRRPQRHAVIGVALGRVQLDLSVADLELAGHRQRLDLAERQRTALDVVL